MLPVRRTALVARTRPLPLPASLPAPLHAVGDGELGRLLARLLAGEPLDRDERAVIVGEVLRLWADETDRALEARQPLLGYSSPRSFATNRS